MKNLFLLLAFWISSLGLTWCQDVTGIKVANLKDADLNLIHNHDPDSERRNFELLPGYKVNLFAAEPMLANPIHMVWDSKGRLWVACSWSYPQLKPGQVADDKIIILEDTDGDGAADKSTVFADGLYMPTGIELANGGCFVAQTPDVFFLKDTDGDDVADVRELALTGFGIEDSHHSISAWRRGPGGWIYFQEGIFLHSQVETQYGVVRNFDGGVYQFNPRTQELRIFCTGTGGNPWGHVFDRWGQSFMVNNPRIMYLTPGTGASEQRPRIPALISTEKQCGGDLASGTHLPDEIRGQLLTGRFKSRTVVRYEFLDKGAGFSARVLEPLIRSKHPNFRPVDVKMGPDGAVYVADWYNSIINHAQHDFRDPRRDHDHGRIWRIAYEERPLTRQPKLVEESIAQLVRHLRSPEHWTRNQTRKELSERDPDQVLDALESWVAGLNPEDEDYDHHLVEAMWACQNVERVSEAILRRVLQARDGNARSAGARMIRYWQSQLSDPVSMIADAAADSFPRTRMEAVLSAGFVPRAEAFAAALRVLDHPRDEFLEAALPQTVAALEPHWRPALQEGSLEFARPEHQAFAEQTAGIGFEKRLAAFLVDPHPDARTISEIQKELVQKGAAPQVRMILRAMDGGTLASTEVTVALLEGLTELGPRSRNGSVRQMGLLRRFLGDPNEALAAGAATALGSWGVKAARKELAELLRSRDRAPQVRTAAAVALAQLGDSESYQLLKAVATEADMEGRYHAMTGLVRVDLDDAKALVGTMLAEDPGKADPVALVSAFLQRRKGDASLVEALRGTTLHPKVIAAVSSHHRQTGQLPKRVAPLFTSPATSSLTSELRRENRETLVADVDRLGDPERGEMVYRRKELACMSCHAIGAAGPAIGPNLVAVGAAATAEYMVESILEPNAAIAEHYENWMFTLADGSMRMGVISYQNNREIVFRDSALGGKEITLAAGDVVRKQSMPSLMPAGLADQLKSRQEFLDLARFLAVLGKPGAFANDESPVIRKWQVTSVSGDRLPADGASWQTHYSKVNGELPLQEFAGGTGWFARGFVEVQVAGEVELRVRGVSSSRVWVDGEPIEDLSLPLHLKQGRRSFLVALDSGSAGASGIRVELVAPDGSQAKFQPEGGL